MAGTGKKERLGRCRLTSPGDLLMEGSGKEKPWPRFSSLAQRAAVVPCPALAGAGGLAMPSGPLTLRILQSTRRPDRCGGIQSRLPGQGQILGEGAEWPPGEGWDAVTGWEVP